MPASDNKIESTMFIETAKNLIVTVTGLAIVTSLAYLTYIGVRDNVTVLSKNNKVTVIKFGKNCTATQGIHARRCNDTFVKSVYLK